MVFPMEEFEELVAEAMEEIPAEFTEKLENIEIMVEEEPAPALLEQMGLRGRGTLFGLYQGVPLTARSTFHTMTLPDRIVIYRRPILQAFQSRRTIIAQIKKTVIHEVAHYFGISDRRLRELGY